MSSPNRSSPLRGGRIPLFSVLGIRVYAHYSWFLVALLIAGTLAIGWFPTVLPGRSLLQYVILGILTAFFFFSSVLIHELAHSVVAVANGIPVRRITLFLFGGIAEISREPSDPRTELKIAIAGPATSAVLAVVFWIAVYLTGLGGGRPAPQVAFLYLAVANTFLLAFNLLPGLPLDGGRVLRAVIWRVTGDITRATYSASLAGKAIAGLLVLGGLLAILTGRGVVTGLWFIFIALFLRQGADASYRQVLARRSPTGIRVDAVMSRNVATVPPSTTLAELVGERFREHGFVSYPVVDGEKLIGTVSIKDTGRVPPEALRTTRVVDVMTPLSPDTMLSPDDDIATAMARMKSSGVGRLPVVRAVECQVGRHQAGVAATARGAIGTRVGDIG